jgi:hypothetical protein
MPRLWRRFSSALSSAEISEDKVGVDTEMGALADVELNVSADEEVGERGVPSGWEVELRGTAMG